MKESIIWGYDLLNERIERTVSDNVIDWHDLSASVVQRICAIDSEHAMIIEGTPVGEPPGVLVDFEPLLLDT